jgi:hypothetical protein
MLKTVKKKKIFNPRIEVFSPFRKPFSIPSADKVATAETEKASACSACTACTACR